MNSKLHDDTQFPHGDLRRTEAAWEALTRWLMSDGVLRASGSAAGVANWLWPSGDHDGLYPEICGYYLQFLALSAACGAVPAATAHQAASQVVRWLDEIGPAGDPPTLVHRNAADSDWRNHCLFAFDLGMIYRGFAAVDARWPGIVGQGLMIRYRASLRSLIYDGRLSSHSLREGAVESQIPVKWSTQVDVHHVKIVAALAGVGPHFATTVAATVAAQAHLLERDGQSRLRELHPFLYSVEGWLMLWGQGGSPAYLEHAATAFHIVLAEFDADAGCLPAIAGRKDLAPRADVLAQALRAGVVLEHAGRLDTSAHSRWLRIRDNLTEGLLLRQTAAGAMEFDRVGRHANVWASMFAWQALRFVNQACTGSLDAKEAAASLI